MTPEVLATRLQRIADAAGAFCQIGQYQCSAVSLNADDAVIWILPPNEDSPLRSRADLYSRVDCLNQVDETWVIRNRASRVDLRWIDRMHQVRRTYGTRRAR